MKIAGLFIFALKLCLVDLKSVTKESSTTVKQGNIVHKNKDIEYFPLVNKHSSKLSKSPSSKEKTKKPFETFDCPIIKEETDVLTEIAENKTIKINDDCTYLTNKKTNDITGGKQKYATRTKRSLSSLQNSQFHNKETQRKSNMSKNEKNTAKENLLTGLKSRDQSNSKSIDNHSNNEKLEDTQNGIAIKSLKEEIQSMFNPNFKSFIFNPMAPVESKFQECETSKNESGTCRYIQHCLLPNVLSSIEQFMNNVCIIERRFIGVCCPEFPVHTLAVKWKNISENIENEPVQVPEECGIGTNKRIVGGLDASIKAWPWMVALLNHKKKFYCGGALINNRYVLTAAHCTVGSRNNEIIARVGEFDLSSEHSFQEDYKVIEIKRHGHYSRMTLRNDIALLKLNKPVVFNEFVKTVCMPEANTNYTNMDATLTGWGHVQGGISVFTSDVLQEASFPVITNKECATLHGIAIPPSLICTAAPSKDKGACNGDSGGPLVMLDDKNRWKVIGIVSWGRRGCSTSYPSVFTRVSHYLDWIKKHAV